MSKWENEYNEIKSKIDSMIEEQNNKISEARRKQASLGKDVNSAEYIEQKESLKTAKKELQRLEKIKLVIPKIENILNYRKSLKEQLEEYKKELFIRNNLNEIDGKMKEAASKIDELQAKAEEIAKKLRNPKITDKERLELQAEKNTISADMAKAQRNRQGLENILAKSLGQKRKLSVLSNEEIKTRITDTKSNISKCNMVAHCLLDGKDWDDIKTKLDNWKDTKYTSKDEDFKEDVKTKRTKKVEKFMDEYAPELEDDAPELEDDTPELENDTPELDKNKPALTFADKHPRLAKIGNFFKGIKDRFIKKDKDETQNTEAKKPLEKEEVTAEEKEEKEEKKSTDNFKDYIRYVAEHGEEVGRRKFLEDKFDRHSDGPKVQTGFSEVDKTAKPTREYEDGGR